jgi:hypothetical protein
MITDDGRIRVLDFGLAKLLEQIEVNHREEKDTLGVGQAQLWNVTSVLKQPVLVVAASALPTTNRPAGFHPAPQI